MCKHQLQYLLSEQTQEKLIVTALDCKSSFMGQTSNYQDQRLHRDQRNEGADIIPKELWFELIDLPICINNFLICFRETVGLEICWWRLNRVLYMKYYAHLGVTINCCTLQSFLNLQYDRSYPLQSIWNMA